MKKHQKLSLLRKNDFATGLGLSKVISETMLNFISSEVREGEIFMVLGMNDPGKFTRIDDLVNHNVAESL